MVALPFHIVGGVLALTFGYVALAAAKGGSVHRRAGMYFVYAMTLMSLTGVLIATVKPDRGSMVAGSLTFYFVLTGLLAVKRVPSARRIEVGAMIAAFVLGAGAVAAGVWLARRGRYEAAPMFLLSALTLGAAFGDLHVLRTGALEPKRRIKRHLWRLCFAMWIAAASFFWGPPNRVPELIRIPALLPFPVLAPIAVMSYWLWRLRGNRSVRIERVRGVSLPLEVTS